MVGFYNFTVPSLIIRDPDLGSQVLFRDCHHFSEHIFNVDETVDPLFGKTLFALKGNIIKIRFINKISVHVNCFYQVINGALCAQRYVLRLLQVNCADFFLYWKNVALI